MLTGELSTDYGLGASMEVIWVSIECEYAQGGIVVQTALFQIWATGTSTCGKDSVAVSKGYNSILLL